MSSVSVDRLKVSGFKSLHEADVELRPLNVLIGPNGAGKSNFIGLFALLQEMVERRFQLAVERGGGADAFLYLGHANTNAIHLELHFGRIGYECTWVPTARDTLTFSEERYWSWDEAQSQRRQVDLGAGHRESGLLELWGADLHPLHLVTADELLGAMRREWRVYHFHDTSDSARVNKAGAINDDLHLRGDASNLAAFLRRLQLADERYYARIVRTIRHVAPFFDDFLLRPLPDNKERIRLEWRERGSDYPFLAHQLSDGTLRFVCLATLLLQPRLPSTIVIDEPELGLHPYALSVLAGLLKTAARQAQVIVSTQSARLVDEFDLDDLLVVERKRPDRGELAPPTTIRRLDAARLAEWLEDYTNSELWEKNVLGGSP